ncbi:pyruvate dehydrogenase E1 component subunit alpha, mitochondrial-like isoform X2 [Choristoneura fumiferana]|uniref:pyruvate dehydrogenase E1 component subunit alpha, mitochondrial-like isoform X2 n=1 Tax=Choristoneura fumiferana TaxID=7141 RepID=UPI003D15D996
MNPIRQYAEEATVPISSPEVHNFDKSKIPTEVKVTRQEALELYENMVLIRRMETEAANLYKAKKIYGFCHLYVGTEAVGTGIVAAMKPTDNLITSYRCHGFAMMFQRQQGKDGPRLVLSELTGKADGLMGGKGGSMHLYVPPHFYGGQGIVGGQVPLGVGLGFGHMYTDDCGVCFALYGDGAANQGQVHESFNIASLLKIPVVFVCENNYYGMGTASERSSSSTNYFQAGRVIPGIRADGMDVITVREIAKVASDYSRSGQGPMIVEMQTYRYYGHSMSDPGVSYRTREEVQAVRKTKDPLNKLKKIIVENKLATDEEIEEINKKAKAACAEAKKAAEAGSEPDAKELYTHLYVKYLEQPRKRTCVG